MGTSGAFTGSASPEAKDLRDSIADWLSDQTGSPDPADQGSPAGMPSSTIGSGIGLWGRGSGGGGGGGASTGGGGSGGGGRSYGGVGRTVGRVSGPAGRAGSIARAYVAGDRGALEAAGLSYDELSRLGDPLEVGQRIADAAFDTLPDGSMADHEARLIVGDLIGWVLEASAGQEPSPEAVVRHTIELMVNRAILTEVGDSIRQEPDRAKREATTQDIRNSAKVWAARADLSATGATPAEISAAIEGGVAELVQIWESE